MHMDIDNKGFSLLEVLSAMTIASVVMSMGIGLIQAGNNIIDSTYAKANDNALALMQLARDLRGCAYPQVSTDHHTLTVKLWGDEMSYNVVKGVSGGPYLAKFINGVEVKRIATNVERINFDIVGGSDLRRQRIEIELWYKNYLTGSSMLSSGGASIIKQKKYIICLRNSHLP